MTSPEIIGFSIDRSTISAAAGDGTVNAHVHVTDDLSGLRQSPLDGLSEVGYGFGFVGPPLSLITTGSFPIKVSGTDLDGIWRLETTLPPNAPPGEYEVFEITATDLAGNYEIIRDAALESKGWNMRPGIARRLRATQPGVPMPSMELPRRLTRRQATAFR